MINIPGFKLIDVTIGCRFIKCFSMTSAWSYCRCDAKSTCFPENHYSTVILLPEAQLLQMTIKSINLKPIGIGWYYLNGRK